MEGWPSDSDDEGLSVATETIINNPALLCEDIEPDGVRPPAANLPAHPSRSLSTAADPVPPSTSDTPMPDSGRPSAHPRSLSAPANLAEGVPRESSLIELFRLGQNLLSNMFGGGGGNPAGGGAPNLGPPSSSSGLPPSPSMASMPTSGELNITIRHRGPMPQVARSRPSGTHPFERPASSQPLHASSSQSSTSGASRQRPNAPPQRGLNPRQTRRFFPPSSTSSMLPNPFAGYPTPPVFPGGFPTSVPSSVGPSAGLGGVGGGDALQNPLVFGSGPMISLPPGLFGSGVPLGALPRPFAQASSPLSNLAGGPMQPTVAGQLAGAGRDDAMIPVVTIAFVVEGFTDPTGSATAPTQTAGPGSGGAEGLPAWPPFPFHTLFPIQRATGPMPAPPAAEAAPEMNGSADILRYLSEVLSNDGAGVDEATEGLDGSSFTTGLFGQRAPSTGNRRSERLSSAARNPTAPPGREAAGHGARVQPGEALGDLLSRITDIAATALSTRARTEAAAARAAGSAAGQTAGGGGTANATGMGRQTLSESIDAVMGMGVGGDRGNAATTAAGVHGGFGAWWGNHAGSLPGGENGSDLFTFLGHHPAQQPPVETQAGEDRPNMTRLEQELQFRSLAQVIAFVRGIIGSGPFRLVFEDGHQHLQGQPPASQEAIDRLRTVAFPVKRKRRKNGGGKVAEAELFSWMCAVCQEGAGPKEDGRALVMPCGHSFHPHCLTPWLKNSNTCPTCRYELMTDNSDYNAGVTQRMASRTSTKSPATTTTTTTTIPSDPLSTDPSVPPQPTPPSSSLSSPSRDEYVLLTGLKRGRAGDDDELGEIPDAGRAIKRRRVFE
ncbi:hypothetical protein HDU67_003585 [Dinochytrium kinnereticum]|nr:hypothetical protein HDU67_003585 [Dinochytrium kinnereticum]